MSKPLAGSLFVRSSPSFSILFSFARSSASGTPRAALRERRELLVDLRPARIVGVRVVKVGRGVEGRRGELPEGVHASQVVLIFGI